MLTTGFNQNKELIAVISIGDGNAIKDLKLPSLVKVEVNECCSNGRRQTHRVTLGKPKRRRLSREFALGHENSCFQREHRRSRLNDKRNLELTRNTLHTTSQPCSSYVLHAYPPNFAPEVGGSSSYRKTRKRSNVDNAAVENRWLLFPKKGNSKELQKRKSKNCVNCKIFDDALKSICMSYLEQLLQMNEYKQIRQIKEACLKTTNPSQVLPKACLLVMTSWMRMWKEEIPRAVCQPMMNANRVVKTVVCCHKGKSLHTIKSSKAVRSESNRNPQASAAHDLATQKAQEVSATQEIFSTQKATAKENSATQDSATEATGTQTPAMQASGTQTSARQSSAATQSPGSREAFATQEASGTDAPATKVFTKQVPHTEDYGWKTATKSEFQREKELVDYAKDLLRHRGCKYRLIKTEEYFESQKWIKTKENLLFRIQEEISCLYVQFARKTHQMHKWENEINMLYLALSEKELLIKNIHEQNSKIYELEQKLGNYQDHVNERDYMIKRQRHRIESLQNTMNEKNLYILELKNSQVRKEVAAQFLNTLQKSLALELKNRDAQLEKLELELNEMKGEVEELQRAKRDAQAHMNEMQESIDALSKEKSELERKLPTITDNWSSATNCEEGGWLQSEYDMLTREMEIQKRTIVFQQDTINRLEKMNESNNYQIRMLAEKNKILQEQYGYWSYPNNKSKMAAGKLSSLDVKGLRDQVNNNNVIIDKLRYESEMKDGRIQFLHTLLITLQNQMKKDETKAKSPAQPSRTAQDRKLFLMGKKLDRLQKENESQQLQIMLLDKEIKADRQITESKKLCIINLRNQILNLQKKFHEVLVEKNEKSMDVISLDAQMQALQKKNKEFEIDVGEKTRQMFQSAAELQKVSHKMELIAQTKESQQQKLEKMGRQMNSYRLELDKKELMISTMQTMINQHQRNEKEKSALIHRLCEKVAKCESCYEKFPLALHNLEWEIKRIKDKAGTPDELGKKLTALLVKTETELRNFDVTYIQDKCKALAKCLHQLTQEKIALKRKYKDKATFRKDVGLQVKPENSEKATCQKLQCLDVELDMLQEMIASKDREMLQVMEKQKEAHKQKLLREKERRLRH